MSIFNNLVKGLAQLFGADEAPKVEAALTTVSATTPEWLKALATDPTKALATVAPNAKVVASGGAITGTQPIVAVRFWAVPGPDMAHVSLWAGEANDEAWGFIRLMPPKGGSKPEASWAPIDVLTGELAEAMTVPSQPIKFTLQPGGARRLTAGTKAEAWAAQSSMSSAIDRLASWLAGENGRRVDFVAILQLEGAHKDVNEHGHGPSTVQPVAGFVLLQVPTRAPATLAGLRAASTPARPRVTQAANAALNPVNALPSFEVPKGAFGEDDTF